MAYLETHRFYRKQHRLKDGWFSFQVKHRESDLWVRARSNLGREAGDILLGLRLRLERYIKEHPAFLTALTPLPLDPLAPPMVRKMLTAAREAGVGPMASVAGAIAEAVGVGLKQLSPEVVVENGGDCYVDLCEETDVGVFAGPRSPFSGKIALRFPLERFPLGICTSSGTVGHSLSFGKADALTVVAKDTALADAAATALGNMVKDEGGMAAALDAAPGIRGIEGVLVIVGERMGIWGNLEIKPL